MTDSKPERETFEIPATQWMEAQDKLTVLNKKAARNKIPLSTYRVVKTWTEKKSIRTKDGPLEIPGQTYHTIELDSVQIKIDGWTFAAKIEHLEAGNMIFNPSGQELDPFWRTAAPRCRHCGHKRHRKETYLVKGMSGTLQVGSTCVKEYTGIDPARVLRWMQYISELRDTLSDEDRYPVEREARFIDTACYLTFVTRAIHLYGWTPRSKADGIHAPTSDVAISFMFDAQQGKVEKEDMPQEEDYNLATAAIEYIKETETKSDYEWNLKVAVRNETFPRQALGIVASLIPYYKRHVEREIEKEERFKEHGEPQHIGIEGKRQDFTLTLTKMLPLEGGQWGPTFLHKFIDADGNFVTWFSSKMYFEGLPGGQMEEGRSYNVKATVKKHDNYNGTPQTLITRAKVTATLDS